MNPHSRTCRADSKSDSRSLDDVEEHLKRHDQTERMPLRRIPIKRPSTEAGNGAPEKAVDNRYGKFLLPNIDSIGQRHLSGGKRAHQKRQRLIAGIAGHARYDGHQSRKCHHALNGAVKG